MRRPPARASAALLLAGAALLLSACGGGGDTDTVAATPNCSAAIEEPAAVYTYRLHAGTENPDDVSRDEAIEIICSRFTAGDFADVEIVPVGAGKIRVAVAPRGSAAAVEPEEIAAQGGLYFFDWEPNVAGGPFASAYEAVRLASRQRPEEECAECSQTAPRFYLFSPGPDHELLAGSEPSEASAFLVAGGGIAAGRGEVLRVPVGTVVVSEEEEGRRERWYVLHDRPALSGSGTRTPRQEVDEFGQTTVAFDFTDAGRRAFHRVTREIARRGRAKAGGRANSEEAEALSGHFAIVFDDEVITLRSSTSARTPTGSTVAPAP